ncbi:unnamed protein product [Enterobius vermicularis]|uniref:Tyrosine-protein kinase n=1 Tax=Enterobius vermicularis TaxID=51028 RepID=A0A0N4VML1_ENTVE|nr:unnamed protein product [Enterobius vermicularis]
MGKSKPVAPTYQYYAGWIPREFAEKLLTAEGEFLVRNTQRERGATDLILSAKHGERFYHFIVFYNGGKYYVKSNDTAKSSVHELIEHYVFSQQPINNQGVILQKPFVRPEYFYEKKQLQTKKVIGKGAFGKVYYGVLRTEKVYQCAVKVVNSKSDDIEGIKKERTKFVKEAFIMLKLHHPNVLAAYGLMFDKDPIKLIMEYAPEGSLKTFLQKTSTRQAPVVLLERFSADAARGLEYLAMMKIIHADIAARNCLVGKDKVLKITDFGLSHTGHKAIKLPELGMAPLKWMAPEAIIKAKDEMELVYCPAA